MKKAYKHNHIPSGFYFLDEKLTSLLKKRSYKAQKLLEKKNFARITPQTVDYPETFNTYGSQNFFQVFDKRGEHLALRNDITIQLVKGFANQLNYNSYDSKENRFYYSLPVFRDAPNTFPYMREIYQIGAEIIGPNSYKSIEEILSIAHNVLLHAFEEDPIILLGDIVHFNSIQKNFKSSLRDIFRWKNAPNLKNILKNKLQNEELAYKITYLLLHSEINNEWLELITKIAHQIKDKNFQNTLFQIVSNSKKLLELKEKLKQKIPVNIRLEPCLVGKVSYYSSLLFEGYVNGITYPPLRGGCYDQLIEKYSNYSIPAAGFAIDMSSLLRI